MTPTALRAGFDRVDLTPPRGTQIAGNIGHHRPAEWVKDPIYARAAVFQAGGRQLCVLSLDVLCIGQQQAGAMRDEAAARFGFDRAAVMVHTTQTHSAPSIGSHFVGEGSTRYPDDLPWLKGGDPAFDAFAHERVMAAVEQAVADLAPATMACASGVEGRVAFNRRFVMRDGTSLMNPSGERRHEVLHREGPIDPELGIVAVAGEGTGLRGLLLHHTCHPVHGFPHRYISADWPGLWADQMAAGQGSGCVGLTLNGCCGDIHHHDIFDPGREDTDQSMAAVLTATGFEVMKRLRFRSDVELDYGSIKIDLPVRDVSRQVELARQYLADNPDPVWQDAEHTRVAWDWVLAHSLLDFYERRDAPEVRQYEIQVFRLGDLALVALGGEPFVEGQLAIKLRSPVRHTYVAHMSNGYHGYIPTAAALARGGYGCGSGNGSRYAAEALELIVEATVGLLHEVFAGHEAKVAVPGRSDKGPLNLALV